MTNALVLLVTAPDRGTAESLATTVVSEGCAACVNLVGPVVSIYRWQDKIERDEEWLLIVKTTRDRFDDVQRRVLELHPYDTPEVLALPVEGGAADYLQWLTTASSR